MKALVNTRAFLWALTSQFVDKKRQQYCWRFLFLRLDSGY